MKLVVEQARRGTAGAGEKSRDRYFVTAFAFIENVARIRVEAAIDSSLGELSKGKNKRVLGR